MIESCGNLKPQNITNFNKDDTNLEHVVGPLLVLLLALRGLQILVLRVMLV